MQTRSRKPPNYSFSIVIASKQDNWAIIKYMFFSFEYNVIGLMNQNLTLKIHFRASNSCEEKKVSLHYYNVEQMTF